MIHLPQLWKGLLPKRNALTVSSLFIQWNALWSDCVNISLDLVLFVMEIIIIMLCLPTAPFFTTNCV